MNIALTALWASGEVFLNAEVAQGFFMDLGPENAGAGAGLRNFTVRVSHVICPLLAVFLAPRTVPSFFMIFGLPTLIAGVVLYRAVKGADEAVA